MKYDKGHAQLLQVVANSNKSNCHAVQWFKHNYAITVSEPYQGFHWMALAEKQSGKGTFVAIANCLGTLHFN